MMARRLLLSGLVLALGITAVGAAGQRARSDQEILMQLEHDWDDAFHRKDVQFIESILADEFIATYSDGARGDKATELARTAAFDQQIDSSRLDDFVVKVYGDTAVVWFSMHLVGPSQGRPLAITFRYVDVFVLRDGRWQCVSSQSTRAAASQASQ